MGLDYKMASLQAVMAEQLGGDTIHHALGLNPFLKEKTARASEQECQKQQDVAKHVMQVRWLIMDEVSMVSANLLADIGMKLWEVV